MFAKAIGNERPKRNIFVANKSRGRWLVFLEVISRAPARDAGKANAYQ
jgi:hypothetical protein